MGMARTVPITPLTQYIAHDEEPKWSSSLSLFRKDWYQWPHELLGTNTHNELGPFTPTGRVSLDNIVYVFFLVDLFEIYILIT